MFIKRLSAKVQRVPFKTGKSDAFGGVRFLLGATDSAIYESTRIFHQPPSKHVRDYRTTLA